MKTTVYVLEAVEDHEPSSIISIYADKEKAEKKRDSMIRAQERYRKAVSKAVDNDTEIKVKCPPHCSSDIIVCGFILK